jgi:hypothetical protein
MNIHIDTHGFSPLKSSLEASESYTVSLLLLFLDHMMVMYCLFSAVILVIPDDKFLLVLEPPFYRSRTAFYRFRTNYLFLLVLDIHVSFLFFCAVLDVDV